MNPRKLKLLIVIIDLSGGTGVYCRNLSLGLRRYFRDEFHVSLLTFREAGVAGGDHAVFDCVQTLGAEISSPIQIVRAAGKLRSAIDQANPDVILTVHTFSNLIVPLVAPRRRIVLTVHGHLTTILKDARHSLLLKALLRWRLPQRSIVAPSRELAEDLVENFDADDVTVIPHGLDLETVGASAKTIPADLPPAPYIIATGRLAAQKDYPTLLRAYALAVQSGIPQHLVILGDGKEMAALRALARELNVGERVYFLGHRNPPYPYISRADFFVLSSVWEGFGLGLVEAMALGVPVISTDCPAGPAEILRGGADGVLVPMRDPRQLAEAMKRMSRDRALRSSLAERAQLRADDFALRRMAAAYRNLLRTK